MNWWMRVLQTLALPLGHVTLFGVMITTPFGATAAYSVHLSLHPPERFLRISGPPRKLAKQDFVGKRRNFRVCYGGLTCKTARQTTDIPTSDPDRARTDDPFVSQTGPPRKLANAKFCGEEEKFQCLSQRSCFARLPDKRLTFRRGASDRNRTNDTGIFSPLLYRLSYRGAPDDDYYT